MSSRSSLAGAAMLAAISLTGCSSNSSTVGGPEPTAAATNVASTAAGTSLSISSFTYSPSPITVAPGTTLSVKNNDDPEHTVTSDTDGLFLADEIRSGKTVSFKAPTKPGTYTFHCEYHANMHGTLIVS